MILETARRAPKQPNKTDLSSRRVNYMPAQDERMKLLVTVDLPLQ